MKTILILLVSFIPTFVSGQELFGFYDYDSYNMNYLRKQNSLDPIEGAWSQETKVQNWNNYKTHPEHVIYEKVCIIKCNKDELEPGKFFLEKIGDSNMYIYNFRLQNGTWVSRRIVLYNNSFSLKVIFDVNDFVGGKVRHEQNFIKISSK